MLKRFYALEMPKCLHYYDYDDIMIIIIIIINKNNNDNNNIFIIIIILGCLERHYILLTICIYIFVYYFLKCIDI